MKSEYKEYENKMQKTIEVIGQEFATIRAGRANPAVLDRITVEYYGTQTPIGQVASISSPEPRMLIIQPWDSSILKAVEKAILVSDIGINPTNDGKIIRLVFPPLTEERRKELIKKVYKIGEDGKVAIRNVRREAIDNFRNQKKNSLMTEDDLIIAEKDVQEFTDKYIEEIDIICQKKEKELSEV
ncbi:MAG: ribosome recycling factor [Clostridiales bacterium]|nr:ribosome recycling factor [Clostridiales bacterium]